MKNLFLLFLLLGSIFISCSENTETITLSIGSRDFQIEIADSPAERTKGLMNRKKLDTFKGMLFIFDEDTNVSFWMKNTSIPLSIAYIAKDGTIKEIHDMVPFSERRIVSTFAVRYALELNKGAFETLDVHPGDKIDFPLSFP
jgi:uncharacterized protein